MSNIIRPMNAPQMLQRMRMRSQLLLKPQSSMGLRRQPSAQSYRSQNNNSSQRRLFSSTFRSKFERILQQKKVHLILDTQHSERVHYNSTSKATEISKEVTSSKKSLNDLIVQRKGLENSSKRLKFQIEKLKAENKVTSDSQAVSDADVKFLIRRDSKLSNIQEYNQQSMLCYEFMRERNQQEIILWRARYQELTLYSKQYSQIIKDLFSEESSLVQAQSDLYSSLEATKVMVDQASEAKGQALLLHKIQIEDKREVERWKSQRGKQREEFKQQAGVEQEKEQVKQYRGYYLANKFLLKLMRSKGERVMERYKTQHAGFQYIRKNTGHHNTTNILQRIQAQDQLYESKLQLISKLESQLKSIEVRHCIETKDKYQIPQTLHRNGYKERQLQDKLQRMRAIKSQKGEEIETMANFEALLKNWVQRISQRMQLGECNSNPTKALALILEKLQEPPKTLHTTR